MTDFTPVYGPVHSWRYGTSLGIDPIGAISTCSFNCVYCQLGKIERSSLVRQTFVSTAEIISLVSQHQEMDVVTISGSGEPTLALNLGEIIAAVKGIISNPLIVLTNGSLLHLNDVRRDLLLADEVSVKLDGITTDRINRISRPAFSWDWQTFWQSLQTFRTMFNARLTIQTMILSAWTIAEEKTYIDQLKTIGIDGIYLNVPRRPKPRHRLLEGRENNSQIDHGIYFSQPDWTYLNNFAQRIQDRSGIPVSWMMETRR